MPDILVNWMFVCCRRLISTRIKVSPAAHWHASLLGISLDGIKGTGPKGHILKGDVLTELTNRNKKSEDIHFLIEYPKSLNELNLKKCIESIRNRMVKKPVINYKILPEIGLLQIKLSVGGRDSRGEYGIGYNVDYEVEKFKKIIKIYLNDSLHLLL